MVRWRPGSPERLQQAALDLFDEQGFERTTVAEIATRAGVTERTFFRHFTDKREVLFEGGAQLEALLVEGVETAGGDTPGEQVAAALARAAEFFGPERRARARQRAAVVAANPALTERELLKLGSLGRALAAALRGRGLDEPAATLLGQSTVTVFQVTFERWVAADEERSFDELQRTTFAMLRRTLAVGADAAG